jgi:methionyl-tRNA formyltransferase
MQTEMEVDAGDVLLQEKLPIYENETSGELFEKLSVLGAEMVKKALVLIESGKAKYTPQDKTKATFTKIIKKEHALINWEETNEEIFNKIRAFNPSPIAYTLYNGLPLKVYTATLADGCGSAGEILNCEKYLEVACGKGSIILEKVQKAGSNAMSAQDFLRGNKLQKGGHLTNA